MILSYESGRLTEKKSYREALRLESSVSPILSITGAGGKTTTALHLAYEYKEVGNPAVVTTSTHLAIWDQPWFLLEESTEKLQQIRRQYGQVWVGIPMTKWQKKEEFGASRQIQKMKAVSEAFFKEICELGVPVIVEADGARQMPCKVPAAHEPVIVPRTTTVCSVYGLDAIGQRICDCCFRAELAAEILGKRETDRLEAADLAKIAADGNGGCKGVLRGMEHWVILNKADTDQRKESAEEVCRELERYGNRRILITSSEENERSERFVQKQ